MIRDMKTKINRIVSELILFQLNEGGSKIKMKLDKQADGYRIRFESNIGEKGAQAAEQLNRFLQAERNEGVENYYWELAGDDEGSDNSELQLIGQMLDEGTATLKNGVLYIDVFKANR